MDERREQEGQDYSDEQKSEDCTHAELSKRESQNQYDLIRARLRAERHWSDNNHLALTDRLSNCVWSHSVPSANIPCACAASSIETKVLPSMVPSM